MIKPVVKRITTKTTTTVADASCLLAQLVISCVNAGTSWTLQIQDKASSPNVLIPSFTLAVPSDGNPNVYLRWNELPLPMNGGIDIITGGTTAGEVSVWMIINTNP